MIKSIVFDFGKVLVDYDFMSKIETFFFDDNSRREFAHLFVNESFQDECDMELIPFVEIINKKKVEYPQFSHALQMLFDNYVDIVTGEVPGMKQLMVSYKEQGLKLYGLTNWCSKVYEVMARYDIFDLLDGRIISSEEHLIKPDVRIYNLLCRRYGLQPDETIFTDDKIVNIEGAIRAGMHGIHFKNARQFSSEVNEIMKHFNSY